MAALVTAACGSGDHSHIVTGASGAGGEATEAGTGATPNGGSTGQIGEAGATSETCSGGSVAPVWPAGATLTATASAGAVSLSWPSATGADRYKVFVDGGEVATVSGLTFLAPLAPGASHTLRVDAGELCGKTATGPAATATASLPPDPATIAPPLPIAALTPFPSAVSFLYTGPNPIQTGMKTGALDDTRVSVVRGKVTACDGTPIPGVKVSVPSAPDLGWTFTRADGQFDMAVNGGCCEVGVQYAAAGYPTVQRKITTPLHEYVNAPDVALVPYDSNVTTVTLPATGAVSAQGSQVKDSAGTRHATVIFPPGVTASMTLPDGTEAPLPTLHVRATEYTSDACGLAAMPGNLPAESAYTYAAELSADEAVQANATAVNFSEPVALYVDNFLNFPNGAAVPTGYYNRTTECWQPVPNGVVVTITSLAGGSAAIDVNGDGVADDAATLGALGITPEETQELAKIYAAGVTLWRSPLPHFSPWDDNWPEHTDAVGAPPTVTPELHIPVAPQPCENGSDIGCLSSSLGESIPIAGVGAALSYSTKWLTPVHLDVPVTPSIGVGALDTALVAVDVAGRHFEQTYQPLPSQTYHFDWDGKDAYGRVVIGSTPIRVKVTYFFPSQYVPAGSAFGAYGTTTTEGDVSWTVNARGDDAFSTQWSGTVSARSPTSAAIGGGWQTSDYLQFDPTNNAVYSGKGDVRKIQQTAHAGQSLTIETIAGTGISGYGGDEGPATQAQFKFPGGLALGPDGSLYISDAEDNRVRKITPDGIIHTIAGTGNQGSGPDEGNALETDLQEPRSLAVDCAGDLYIGDQNDDKFRKLTPDGKIHAVPFRQMNYFEGLDGPAASASLDVSETAAGIAVGSDCRVYFADGQGLVARLDPDGYLRLVAGSTAYLYTGTGFAENTPARNTWYGDMETFAYDPANGSLLFATGDLLSGQSIIRVTSDGLQHLVAGLTPSYFPYAVGDGIPALAATIVNPFGLRSLNLNDGSFVFIDTGPSTPNVSLPTWVRMVDQAGVIHTLAGNGSQQGEGIRAFDAAINGAEALALAPDNTIYVAVSEEKRIRRIGALTGIGARVEPVSAGVASASAAAAVAHLPPAADTLSPNETAVPDTSGSVVDVFDKVSGQHLRSFDALTGVLLNAYTYDDSGKLTSAVDTFGNTTAYAYDDGGKLTSVTSPYNQVTTLHYDADLNLDSVTNPAGEVYRMSYQSGTALLATFQSPSGNTSAFDYDSLGRLSKDSDAAGGSKTVVPVTDDGTNTTTTITTALGRTNTYSATVNSDGTVASRTVQKAYGASSASATDATGKRVVTYEGGSTLTTSSDEDPRFGDLVSIANSISIQNGNQNSVINSARTYTLSDQLNPFSLTNFSETTTVDGNAHVKTYDRLGKTITVQSPAGRTSTSKLNDLGQVIEIDHPSVAPITISYDTYGRPTGYTQGQRSSALGYDEHGYVNLTTDALGHTQHFSRDAVGRLLSTSFGDASNAPAIGSTYDLDSNLTSLTPPSGAEHDLTYTPVDLLASYSPPLLTGAKARTSLTFTRNLDRQVTDVTRADGALIHFDFDAATARASAVTLPGDDGKIALTYDDANTKDILSSSGPAGTSVTLGYTDGLVSSLTWGGTVSGVVRKSYDGKFRLANESVDGFADTTRYGYDADGLLAFVGFLSINRESATGRVSSTTVGAVSDSRSYDATYGEPAEYSVKTSSSTLFDDVYERDALGRITTKTETVNGTTTKYAYTYDDRGRLETVTTNGSVSASYSYDLNGNRTERQAGATTEDGTYDEQDRLTSYGNATYTYTDDGELLTKTVGTAVTSYHYDALSNLRRITLPDGSVISYEVDAAGRRVGKSVDGALVNGYLYRNASQLKAVLDSTGNVIQSFAYGPSSVPVLMTTTTGSYRLIADHLGSVRLVVDSNSGLVVQRLSYDEFGRVTEDTNPGFQPFGYAGGLYDPQTSLVRFGARDYDPQIGRWTTKDPLLLGGGPNVYIYVGNDPINLTDISGLLAGVPDWLLWLDDHGVLQAAGDFSAGVSSALTFGLSDKLIAATGLGKYGSTCSGAYFLGNVAGIAVGFVGGSLAGLAESAVAEGAEATAAIPARMARVIPAEFAGGASLAGPGATEAWVTAADDLEGISTSEGLANRLALVDEGGNPIPGARAVIEFDTETEGLASPVLRDTPGFVGGGVTAGGASEFVMPNLSLSQLSNVTVRIIQ